MYNYAESKRNIFTDEGQRLFLAIRDKTEKLLKDAGAARCQEMVAGNTGSSWDMLACVDRMVELGEICEITASGVRGQDRVFVRVNKTA